MKDKVLSDFFAKYNGQRARQTSADNALETMTDKALATFLGSYKKMGETGRNEGGKELTASEVRTLAIQIKKMMDEVRRRGIEL